MTREIHPVTKWSSRSEAPKPEVNENRFWLVSPISYEDTIKLASSDVVENFTRDPTKGEARFWPGNKGVFKHLSDNLPDGATIVDDAGTFMFGPKVKVNFTDWS